MATPTDKTVFAWIDESYAIEQRLKLLNVSTKDLECYQENMPQDPKSQEPATLDSEKVDGQ